MSHNIAKENKEFGAKFRFHLQERKEARQDPSTKDTAGFPELPK
jgi:hypothetical protein